MVETLPSGKETRQEKREKKKKGKVGEGCQVWALASAGECSPSSLCAQLLCENQVLTYQLVTSLRAPVGCARCDVVHRSGLLLHSVRGTMLVPFQEHFLLSNTVPNT